MTSYVEPDEWSWGFIQERILAANAALGGKITPGGYEYTEDAVEWLTVQGYIWRNINIDISKKQLCAAYDLIAKEAMTKPTYDEVVSFLIDGSDLIKNFMRSRV